MITDFTPVPALIGGAMIGLAATLLLLATGRVAGVSGITAGAIAAPAQSATGGQPFSSA